MIFGKRYGLRIDQYAGPWVSLGLHVHFYPPRESHIDIHFGWWLIVIGRHYSPHDKGGCYQPKGKRIDASRPPRGGSAFTPADKVPFSGSPPRNFTELLKRIEAVGSDVEGLEVRVEILEDMTKRR